MQVAIWLEVHWLTAGHPLGTLEMKSHELVDRTLSLRFDGAHAICLHLRACLQLVRHDVVRHQVQRGQLAVRSIALQSGRAGPSIAIQNVRLNMLMLNIPLLWLSGKWYHASTLLIIMLWVPPDPQSVRRHVVR